MTELLFRGKREDTGEIVYGEFLFFNEHEVTIATIDEDKGIGDFIPVDPATVERYMGQKDENGNKIWEKV